MLALFLFLNVAHASVESEPTFGVEWTFSSEKTVGGDNRARREVVLEFRDQVLKSCREARDVCTWKPLEGSGYRVAYSSGWHFDITLDENVIEVISAPGTHGTFTNHANRIVRDIFAVADTLKMKIGGGGGHIHMGVESAFGNDALAFRNFFVDYFNHPGMVAFGMGLGEPALHNLSYRDRMQFAHIVDEFDQGRMPRAIQDLAQRIQKEVYAVSSSVGFNYRLREKFNALNFTRIEPTRPMSEWTIEFRNVIQSNAKDAFEQINVFRRRLLALRATKDAIPIHSRLLARKFVGDLDEFRDDLKRYYVGAGLEPNNRNYLINIEIGMAPLNPRRTLGQCVRDFARNFIFSEP